MKKLKRKIQKKLIPFLAYCLSRLINSTLKITVKNEDRLAAIKKDNRPIIFAFWHGHLWLTSYHFRDRGYIGLASPSRDGEYISRLLMKFGWNIIRGSSSRGGARSLLKLIKKLKEGRDIVITPDGPQGPIHQVKPGIVYLAQKTDSVIIPVGVYFKKKVKFSSWDQFQLPYPFTKAALVYGDEIELRADLSEKELEEQQKLIAAKINNAALEAKELLEDKSEA